jgi:rhodanese-related sulfurtransferase
MTLAIVTGVILMNRSQQEREVTRVTIDEVKQRIDRGEPLVFVDTRNPQAWEQSEVKLPGAIRIPADEVYNHLHEIPLGRTIITYCT